jgi:hypothetical protein
MFANLSLCGKQCQHQISVYFHTPTPKSGVLGGSGLDELPKNTLVLFGSDGSQSL